MASTLLLDRTLWDLVLDANGNLAVASDPYSVAQDVASAARTYLGEVYYDTTLGVPYSQLILGKFPPLQLVRQFLVEAALTVPGVTDPVVFISSFTDRGLSGQVRFTDPSGGVLTADVTTPPPPS